MELTEVYIWTGFNQRLDTGFSGTATMFENHLEVEKDKFDGPSHCLCLVLIMHTLNVSATPCGACNGRECWNYSVLPNVAKKCAAANQSCALAQSLSCMVSCDMCFVREYKPRYAWTLHFLSLIRYLSATKSYCAPNFNHHS